MTDYLQFIKPELLVLIPVLYFIGVWCKASNHIKDWLIPFILMSISIVLTATYLISMEFASAGNLVAAYIFTSVVQGTLCAAAAVFTENVKRQITVGRKEDN